MNSLTNALIIPAIIFLAAPAGAAPMAAWYGAGPYACDGRCSLDWAVSTLPADQQAEVRRAIAASPTPGFVAVQPDAYITHMAYFRDGAPHMDTRGTVVVSDEAKPAWGWVIDGYAFVKIDECQNWALVQDAALSLDPALTDSIAPDVTDRGWTGGGPSWSMGGSSGGSSYGGSSSTSYASDTSTGDTIINEVIEGDTIHHHGPDEPCKPWCPPEPTTPVYPETPEPAVVPIPASLHLMAGAILSLIIGAALVRWVGNAEQLRGKDKSGWA